MHKLVSHLPYIVQMCCLAYQMAESEGKREVSPVKKTAGRTWLRLFLKRHAPGSIQNLSIARAMGANLVQINYFFEQYYL